VACHAGVTTGRTESVRTETATHNWPVNRTTQLSRLSQLGCSFPAARHSGRPSNTSPAFSTTFNASRAAAQEYSPGRKPWVQEGSDSAPKGREKRSHTHSNSRIPGSRLVAPQLALAAVLHQIQKRLMHARIVSQLRMESSGHRFALPNYHRVFAFRRQDFDIRS
jgi:hypothetical protein